MPRASARQLPRRLPHDRRPMDRARCRHRSAARMRVGAPFLFVSLGECLTEKSGRINLGLEGVLVLSAMAAFGGAYLTDSAWLGVLIGAAAGALLALLHGLLCSLDRVNDVATGIALMLLGTRARVLPGQAADPAAGAAAPGDSAGLLERQHGGAARRCRSMRWCPSASRSPCCCAGASRAPAPASLVRMAGDSADAARALGYSVIGPAHRGRPRRAASSPGSAAPRSRCSTRAAGTKASPAGRA